MRERTYQIISRETSYDPLSHFYDLYIMALAFFSVVPLMFRNVTAAQAVILSRLETVTVFLLLFDYVLRWMTLITESESTRCGPLSDIRLPYWPL